MLFGLIASAAHSAARTVQVSFDTSKWQNEDGTRTHSMKCRSRQARIEDCTRYIAIHERNAVYFASKWFVWNRAAKIAAQLQAVREITAEREALRRGEDV